MRRRRRQPAPAHLERRAQRRRALVAGWAPDRLRLRPGDQERPLRPAGSTAARRASSTRHSQAISDLAWSPDGATHRLRHARSTRRTRTRTSRRPARRRGCASPAGIDYKQDGRGYLGDTRQQVFVVDVASGERRAADRRGRRPRLAALVAGRHAGWPRSAPARNGMRSQLALIDVASRRDAAGRAGGRRRRRLGLVAGRRPHHLRRRHGADRGSSTSSSTTWRRTRSRRLTDDLPCLPDAGYPRPLAALAAGLARRPAGAVPRRPRRRERSLRHRQRQRRASRRSPTWQALHSGLSVDAAGRYVVQGSTAASTPSARSSSPTAQTGTTLADHRLNAAVLAEAPPARWERFDVRRGELRRSRPGCCSRPTSTRPSATRSCSTSTAGRTASTATASNAGPAVPGDQRLPGRLRQPARLRLLRPRASPSR